MVLDIQGKLRVALGTVKDHVSIGKAMIYNHEGKAFSDIEVAVVRATGHDHGRPIDDKHMHEILFLVSNSPGSIPFLAECISRRLAKTSDNRVALKTLLLIHRLLRGGNRCFEQQLRGAHASGHLQIMSFPCFLKRTSSTCFLRKYAAYLEERIGWVINHAGKLEPAIPQGDFEFGCCDEKAIDIIFRKLPKCQAFIDRVLDCLLLDESEMPKIDSLVQAAMCNTLKESFQVYKKYCGGVAAMVNMFFDLAGPARGLACQILRRVSKQSQELYDMYGNCKKRLKNKSLEYPVMQIITMDHVMALEKCTGNAANATTTSTSTPPGVLDCLAAMEGEEEGEKGGSSFGFSSTLFSCTLETKISKVWVVFEDDQDQESYTH